MSSVSKAQLQAQFDLFAANLTEVDGVSKDIVLCPLCLKAFGSQALSDPTERGLSIEHIIPSSLGGKVITLTCRACNNRTASEIEAHFVRMVRAEDWIIGDGSTLNGGLTIGEMKLPMKIAWAKGANPVVMTVPGGKPEALEHAAQQFANLAKGDTLSLSVKFDYKKINAKRGLIRIAYLTLFSTFGYGYILTAAGEKIRDIINEGVAEDVAPFSLHIDNPQENGYQPALRIKLITNGDTISAYLVLVRLHTSQTKYYGILMPGPGMLSDVNFFTKLDEVKHQIVGKRHST